MKFYFLIGILVSNATFCVPQFSENKPKNAVSQGDLCNQLLHKQIVAWVHLLDSIPECYSPAYDEQSRRNYAAMVHGRQVLMQAAHTLHDTHLVNEIDALWTAFNQRLRQAHIVLDRPAGNT
jgi:hypothetical protein